MIGLDLQYVIGAQIGRWSKPDPDRLVELHDFGRYSTHRQTGTLGRTLTTSDRSIFDPPPPRTLGGDLIEIVGRKSTLLFSTVFFVPWSRGKRIVKMAGWGSEGYGPRLRGRSVSGGHWASLCTPGWGTVTRRTWAGSILIQSSWWGLVREMPCVGFVSLPSRRSHCHSTKSIL